MQEDFDLKKMIEMMQTSLHDQIAAVKEDAERARQDVDAILELLDDSVARAKEKDTDRIERLEQAVSNLLKLEKERAHFQLTTVKITARSMLTYGYVNFALIKVVDAVLEMRGGGDSLPHIQEIAKILGQWEQANDELKNVVDNKTFSKYVRKWTKEIQKGGINTISTSHS